MAAAMVTAPMGTLTKSTQRQLSSEVSTPPRTTPAAPPAPAMALHNPSALASRWPEKVVTMMVSVAGDSTAPPTPCTARAAVSQPEVWAKPPTRLAAEKRARPNR